MPYAEHTSVSIENSKAEIEKTIRRYGGRDITSILKDSVEPIMFGVAFTFNERQIRIMVEMPSYDDPQFHETGTGRKRRGDSPMKAWEQAARQRFRALALVVKAKLESVETGVATFEQEFMAHIVLPNGSTVGEMILPQIEHAYKTKQMPPLLPYNPKA